MAAVDITVHLSSLSIRDLQSISVVTPAGIIEFVPSPPSGSGLFSTAYAEPAPGKYCVIVEVPTDPVPFPGPVDDPPRAGA
jgi:hypothetical protein